MRLRIQFWLRASLLIPAALVLVSCATGGPAKDPSSSSAPPKTELFSAPFDHVWRAIQLALSSYPIMVNDADMGVIETDWIRGDKAWVSPPKTDIPVGGFRYKIIVRALRGSDPDSHLAKVKVTILKQAEVQRDFFSNFEKQPSDGLEELAIAYRVKRELQIEKGLQRAQKKQNQSENFDDL